MFRTFFVGCLFFFLIHFLIHFFFFVFSQHFARMENFWFHRRAVCRIDIMDECGLKPESGGSGFHFGGGWVITNSHVVGPNADLLNLSRITFPNDRIVRVFSPLRRVCFLVDIKCEGDGGADLSTADLAMFLIRGEEHEYGLPAAMNDQSDSHPVIVPFDVEDSVRLVCGMQTTCFHYGWGANQKPPTNLLVSFNEVVEKVVEGRGEVPSIVFRANATTSGGSSGAPVFDQASLQLIGVHFADGDGSALAVHFSTTVRGILSALACCLFPVQSIQDIVASPILPPQREASLRELLDQTVTRLKDALAQIRSHMRVFVPGFGVLKVELKTDYIKKQQN
jgi:S1-C subfamily serine protease